jgi:hypothetical protein
LTVSNIIQSDFSAGELSPKIHGRFNLKLYKRGLELCENFIVEPQGSARYRSGSRYVNHTRLNRIARFMPFQFNDEQAYMLEFTALYMRVFRNEGAVLENSVTITGATSADPVVVTATSHGYSNGDEVFISSVGGMTEINGNFYLVADKTANTFELTDVDGDDVDGTGFTTYTSGGTSAKVFEVATPYLESQLFELDFDQNADVLTVTHTKHDIRNITRTNHHVWTVSTFSRTEDPFPSQAITGITQANPGVVTYSGADSYANDDYITIQEVVGMTEVNGNSYIISSVDTAANTFALTDSSGTNVNTSGYTAYSSGGKIGDYPKTVGYYEGRRFYGNTLTLPETFWGSRAPDSSTDGLPRYTDHTSGTDADHAVSFTIAPSFEGTVNAIQWIAGMTDFLGLGTFGGINKATGTGSNDPIAPDSINVKPLSDVGCEAINPIPRGKIIIYVQRGKLKIRSLEYDIFSEAFSPIDRNFTADHISESGFVQVAFQDGDPDLLWGVLTNGKLAGLTFKTSEDVSGWHRHVLGGTDVKVLSVGAMTLPDSFDQLWLIVERTINSLTRRYIEFFEDEPIIPKRSNFITGDTNETTDDNTFNNAMFEAQKEYMHLDSALSYDGTTAGSNASASVTPASSAEATGVTFTANAAVFSASDVDREIWKKAIDGVGEGRAVITSYTSTTEVECTIIKAFDNTSAMAAGNWYLTTNSVSGLAHLEGETITIITDGAEHPSGNTVTDGSVTLDYQASTIHVGLGYNGRIMTLNLEGGNVTGAGQSKPSRVVKLNPRFFNTARARFGTDFYNLIEAVFRDTASSTNRPQPLFSGVPKTDIVFPATWSKDKRIIVEQTHPLPCIIQSLDIFMEVSDE